MTDKQIINMLKELIEEIDYDLYKETFVKECIEDKVQCKEFVKNLVSIVRKHIE